MSYPEPMSNPFAKPEESTPGARQVLRFLAVVGVAVVLVQEMIAASPLQPRQEEGFAVLAVAGLAALVMLVWGLPNAWQWLKGHPDLLVPLGVLTLAEAVLGWLTLIPAMAAVFTPSAPLQLATLSVTVSASLVVLVALNVAYAAWTTTLILSVLRDERSDPAAALARSWRWFFRMLGLELVGWGVLFAGLALAIALAPVSMFLALTAVGVGALLWNLATAALLPLALDERYGFGEALATGIRVSWNSKGLWWKPVVAQMLLLGWLTLTIASYSETTPRGYRRHDVTNWAVNGFWTGGYENECRWYGERAKAQRTAKLSVISTTLGLAFGVLAIGVKLTITQRLRLWQTWSDATHDWEPPEPEHDDDRFERGERWEV
jgi:hypothetical protein